MYFFLINRKDLNLNFHPLNMTYPKLITHSDNGISRHTNFIKLYHMRKWLKLQNLISIRRPVTMILRTLLIKDNTVTNNLTIYIPNLQISYMYTGCSLFDT